MKFFANTKRQKMYELQVMKLNEWPLICSEFNWKKKCIPLKPITVAASKQDVSKNYKFSIHISC